jgi:hypothetical protein
MGAGLGIGLGSYWLLKNKNVTDWDDPKLSQRFDVGAWVFDNNGLGVNFAGHPATGAFSYSLSRANHQSVAGAFGYSFLTSFIWEFVIEFKEKVSVNDVLVTPGGGLPLGEFFYKFGLYLDTKAENRALIEPLRWLLGTGVALDRALDGRPPPRVLSRDPLGFSRRIWHEFGARADVLSVSTTGEPDYARYGVSLGGRLVTLKGYGRAGSFGRAFKGAEISDFAAASEVSTYGAGFSLDADTILAGYHAQDLEGRYGEERGAWITFGSGMGYEYLRSSANRYASVERAAALPKPDVEYQVPDRREQFAALELPGIAVEGGVRGSWGKFEASSRLEPAFGALSAPAFYLWTAQNPAEVSKHIMHRHGYFYGWGGAVKLSLRLALGPLRAGGELRYAGLQSQDGLDRHAEELTIDEHAAGDVLRAGGWLGVSPGAGVSLGVRLGVRRFSSQVGQFVVKERAVERGLHAEWVF